MHEGPAQDGPARPTTVDRGSAPPARWFRWVLSLTCMALAGIAATAVASQVEELSAMRLTLLVSVALVGTLTLVVRKPKPVLLACWILSGSYFRPYMVPAELTGIEGLYFTLSDVGLGLLCLLWLYEMVFLKRSREPLSKGMGGWFLPWFAAIFVSAALAGDIGRTSGELIRVLRGALILLYCRYNLGPAEWRLCAVAFGLSAFAQGAIGSFQGLTGRLAPSVDEDGGWIRASGTLMHPSILSAYILLLAPAILVAGATARRRAFRICGVVGAGIAYFGMALTLSRWPWVMACVELVLVAAALVATGRLRLKRALGLGLVVLVAGLLALVPFREKFLQRLTGDLSRSVDFRAEMAQLALDLWRDHPVFGVGLNHFTIELLKRQPEQESSFRFYEEMLGKGYRSPMVVHNLYLLLLAETGLAGLAGFLFFVARMLWLAARAARQAEGPEWAVCTGVLIGILGVLGHMISDFCLWLDPIFVVWFVLAAMLNGAAAWSPLVWRQGLRPAAAAAANGG